MQALNIVLLIAYFIVYLNASNLASVIKCDLLFSRLRMNVISHGEGLTRHQELSFGRGKMVRLDHMKSWMYSLESTWKMLTSSPKEP